MTILSLTVFILIALQHTQQQHTRQQHQQQQQLKQQQQQQQQQIRFNYHPIQNTHQFQLTQAIHISTSNSLLLRRTFNNDDRNQIDIRSQFKTTAINNQSYYPSTHALKLTTGTIWTHKSTLPQWKLAHQHQIKNDRLFKKHSIPTNRSSTLNWFPSQVVIPDVTDIETLAGLAKMTNNAYTLPGDDRWYDPGGSWNLSDSFGWEEDGLRGHVFATPDNSTVVVAIKGTSAGLLGNGGPTGTNDKLNDNLFFSCCCARISWSWTPVCDCYSGPNRCKESCVEEALINKSVYFPAAVDLYEDIVGQYPNSQIWFTGHSLGAALAGILGVTFGMPAVGFEAPGDLLPAQRLHLPLPPAANLSSGNHLSQVYHVFHTADPIAMGTCNGALSSCSVAGYALETRCHLGNSIIFETAEKLKWTQDIRTHPIQTVIEKVLRPDWMAPAALTGRAECADGWSTGGWAAIAGIRWPWKRRPDCSDTTDPPASVVPVAQPQLCPEPDCAAWEFRDSWDDTGLL